MRKLLAFLLLTLTLSCNSAGLKHLQSEITTPSGDKIKTYLALTPSEQEQGLSGIQNNHFNSNEGMIFYNKLAGDKSFWMPDTYFNLDLFYLDKDLKVIDIVRNLQHYKGRSNPSIIPRARTVWAQHVLELRADSPIAKKIQIGDQLKMELNDKIKKAIEGL